MVIEFQRLKTLGLDFGTLFKRTTSTGRYYAEIDGLRFMAIAFVILYHLSERSVRQFEHLGYDDATVKFWKAFFHIGDVGVHLFFVISGYVIAKPFLEHYALKETTAFSIKNFYKRRITRLEPPYLLVMTGIFLFLTLTGYQSSIAKGFNENQAPLWQSFLASISYTHSVWFNFEPKLNPPAWSLEIEIRFYLIAPLLMAAYFSRRQYIPARIGLVLLMVAFICFQGFAAEGFYINNKQSIFSFVQYFLLGIFLCDMHLRTNDWKPTHGATGITDAIAILSLALFAWSESIIESYAARESAKLILISMIFYGAFFGNHFSAFLRNGFIASLGGMCYSIYLIHMPIMQVLCEKIGNILKFDQFIFFMMFQGVIIVPIIFLISAAYFLLIEKPCMNPAWPRQLLTMAHRLKSLI